MSEADAAGHELEQVERELREMLLKCSTEGQFCQDRQTELECHESRLSALAAPLQEELDAARERLREQVDESVMIVEDEMACCCRFEDERERMIVSLEQRLREQSQEHLGRALLAADRTVHALQSTASMRETLIRDLEEDLGRATAYLKVLAMDVETRFANGPVQCASLPHNVEQHTLSGSGLLSVRPEDLLPSILPGVVRDFFWGDGFSDVRKHGLHERAVQTPCGDFTSLVVADWEHDGWPWHPEDAAALQDVEGWWQTDIFQQGMFCLKDSGLPSARFQEEAQLLRDCLACEMRHLRDLLCIDSDIEVVLDPSRQLLRSVAVGEADTHRSGVSSAALLGWTPWHVAAGFGEPAIIECLKQDMVENTGHYVVLSSRTTRMGLPPLGIACLLGRVDVVQSLLLGMAPVDSRDFRGNTALMWAIAGRHHDKLVPLLLEARVR